MDIDQFSNYKKADVRKISVFLFMFPLDFGKRIVYIGYIQRDNKEFQTMETKQIDWSKKRTPKDIKAGDIITWEVTTDPIRGYYRDHRAIVKEVNGLNITTAGGDYLYWTDLKKRPNFKVIQSNWVSC